MSLSALPNKIGFYNIWVLKILTAYLRDRRGKDSGLLFIMVLTLARAAAHPLVSRKEQLYKQGPTLLDPPQIFPGLEDHVRSARTWWTESLGQPGTQPVSKLSSSFSFQRTHVPLPDKASDVEQHDADAHPPWNISLGWSGPHVRKLYELSRAITLQVIASHFWMSWHWLFMLHISRSSFNL